MERPSSFAFFMLFGSLLLATSRQCAAAPIIGTQTQADQLVGFVRAATDASIAHLQSPCDPSVAIPGKCVGPLSAFPNVVRDLLNLDLGVDVSSTFCSGECRNVYGDQLNKFRDLYSGGVATQSTAAVAPNCDGTLPPFLVSGDGITRDSNKALINAIQGFACLNNDQGQRCASSAVLGKTLSDSGLVEWLRNPTPSLKKILDGLGAGQAPTNGDMAGVLEELGPRLPGFCAALAEGSCCAGSAMEMLAKLLPSVCLGRLGTIFAGFQPLCSSAGHPIPEACGGVDYAGLGSAPSGCPDITTALNQLYSLKPLSSSQYAGCTLPANTCPRDDCELMWCK